jgi:hypothetical protein
MPPQISHKKHQPGRLGTKEKISFAQTNVEWKRFSLVTGVNKPGCQYFMDVPIFLAPCKQPENHTEYDNYEEKFKRPICLWVLFLTSLQIASQSCHPDTKAALGAGLCLV